ncbi:MAG: ATP-binding protein [Muribaculaceae bacterium]|nr:ATP-binding protein [Muribaculaceae bacterium]
MEGKIIFKRKLYQRLLDWKTDSHGDSAILIEGARRVGKSTLVEEFVNKEYKSAIIIDFGNADKEVVRLFDNLSNLDTLFAQLQFAYNIRLYERESAIVFDEVQLCPKARQAIKYLVADGRFDYIETGSLISLSRNVKNILIPSEEDSIKMNPMDFEEFLWATGNDIVADLLRNATADLRDIGQVAHRKAMELFRFYMLIGGMPQAISKFLISNNFMEVDKVKRGILKLYQKDFKKFDQTGRAGRLYDAIPGQLSKNVSRYIPSSVIGSNVTQKTEDSLISALKESMTVNLSYHTLNPANGLAMDYDKDFFKMFVADTGLFITLAFKDKDFTDNIIYRKLLTDKLEANLGYVYENIVGQILVALNRELFYYTFPSQSRHSYEVDFLISAGHKIVPIEVKSSGYKTHASLDAFIDKYKNKVTSPMVVYTKPLSRERGILYLPIYMLPFQ